MSARRTGGRTPESTDELLVEVLRLSRREQARVVEQLLSSLEEPDDQVATAWAIALERRSREVADGRVQTTDWDTARAEILKELDERRARRSARTVSRPASSKRRRI